jgi:hypothetical protein
VDKVKGVANQAGGKVKGGVGKAIGNEQMQVKGLAQQASLRRPFARAFPLSRRSRMWPDKVHEKL